MVRSKAWYEGVACSAIPVIADWIADAIDSTVVVVVVVVVVVRTPYEMNVIENRSTSER
jgi:hypothetical protein